MGEDDDNFVILYDDRGYCLILLDVFFCDTEFQDAEKVYLHDLEKLLVGRLTNIEFGMDAAKIFERGDILTTNVYFFEKELCSKEDIDGVLELFDKHKDEKDGYDKYYVIPNITLTKEELEDE